MLIGMKDVLKHIGISIIACCAVLVCTMFFNFYLDVQQIEGQITTEAAWLFYRAQVMTAKVVCGVSGGCLLLTAVVMLLFYIKLYIDAHKKELGILKALGYSNSRVAKNFWVFGLGAFVGTAAGFGGAFLLMPWFYALQNEDKLLPEIALRFHPSVFAYFVCLPTLGLSLLAVGYAWWKLKQPVLSLLKEDFPAFTKARSRKEKESGESPFLEDLKRNTIKTKKALAFFAAFAAFCFSSMTQMSFSMKELASEMMGAMMLLIGLTLALTTLFLAVTTVVHGNAKTIAVMRAFGYSQKECSRSLLGGYRPLSYLGFLLGTGYQYALLRLMVDVVFKHIEGVPVYRFDLPAMFLSLAAFVLFYELLMRACSQKIKKITIKEIMIE